MLLFLISPASNTMKVSESHILPVKYEIWDIVLLLANQIRDIFRVNEKTTYDDVKNKPVLYP